MKKILTIAIVSAVMILGLSSMAQAYVFMDFESPAFAPDTAIGDHNHVYVTPDGNVTFNGRIWNKLDGQKIGMASGPYFLKNTGERNGKGEDVLTLLFDFGVKDISLNLYGFKSAQPNYGVMIYDIDDALILDDTFQGLGAWEFVSETYSPKPAKKFVLYSLSGKGNNFALDNIAVNQTVPEPATMSLLGLSMIGMGLAGLRKKKR